MIYRERLLSKLRIYIRTTFYITNHKKRLIMKFNLLTLLLTSLSIQALAGPVASWKFDSSKRKLDDYSSGQHPLKMIGEAAKFGKKGFDEKTKYAAQFNGTEDTMLLVTPHKNFNSESFSFLAHAKSDIKKDGKYRAVFYAREKDGFALYLSPRGNWELWTKGGGMTWNKHQITEVVENQWEQFLVSYNAQSQDPQNPGHGRLQIWQNGEIKVDTYTSYTPAKSKLSIGASTVGTANFKGTIDNVEFWDSPLLALNATSTNIPRGIIEQDIQVAALKLNALNFNFDTQFELLGKDSKHFKLVGSKLFINANTDLSQVNSLEIIIKASGGKIVNKSEFCFSFPVATHTAIKMQ